MDMTWSRNHGYDMISQPWILECLNMFKFSMLVINFMKTGEWKWIVGRQRKEKKNPKIQRSIFRMDLLHLLLFSILIIPLNYSLKRMKRWVSIQKTIKKIYLRYNNLLFFLFLSLRVFGLLSSSLLLFPQRFGRYVLRPSSGVCRTKKPSRNFELSPLLNPRGSPGLIPLTITGYKC